MPRVALRFDGPNDAASARAALFGALRESRRFSLIVPGGFAVNTLMHVDNDGPAAARFLRDFHRACVGGAFGGVTGNFEPLNYFDPR